MITITPGLLATIIVALITLVGGFIAWLTKLAHDMGQIRGMLETTLEVHEDRLDSHDRRFGEHSRRLTSIQIAIGPGPNGSS